MTKHGSHGTGLKDAIACSVRLGIEISIETIGNTFTFCPNLTDAHVHVRTVHNSRTNGTKVTVPSQNAKNDLKKITERFLFLANPAPTTVLSGNPKVDIYHSIDGRGGLMMMGVKKDNHPPLSYLYNFKEPSIAQKNSIARNHAVMKSCFKKHFRAAIFKANVNESFGVIQYVPIPQQMNVSVPTPAAAAPSAHFSAIVPSLPTQTARVVDRTVQGDLARDLDAHCMIQDYHVWTLASEDRKTTRDTASTIVTILRDIKGIRVSSTIEHGSLAKNTFVPLSSDIDIVVEIVGFYGNEESTSDKLKTQLRTLGCRFEDGGHRILNFTFNGVQFDLVLIDSAKLDARSKMIEVQGERTATVVMGTVPAGAGAGAEANPARQKQQSFMRAVKYWAKRHGIPIKSCSLEMAVLGMWPELTSAATTHPFRNFLGGVVAQLQDPAIKDNYDLSVKSIAEVDTKAKATLALLV